MKRLMAACATPVAAVALFGCSTSSQQPPSAPATHDATTTISPAPPAATFSTAAPAGVDSACEHAPISAQHLVGDWTEEGDPTVTTLSADGALKSGRDQSGSWRYAPWASTPGKSSMPAGEDKQCVLWLHYQSPEPSMDLVYVPLKATGELLDLSYVGRGNTLHWVRPKSAT